jgi:uncharacterized membrane protein
MRSFFACYVFCIWASVATAFDYPALHSVVGVAADDLLNVREAPSTSSPVIAALRHTASGVEIIKTTEDGKWGLINVAERTGWTAMQHLAKTVDAAQNTQCFGTEPFWNASFGALASFERAGKPAQDYPTLVTTNSANRTDRFAAVAQGPSGQLVATTTVKECSDGMSDRLYGLSVELLVQSTGGWAQYSGCCSLTK